MLSFCFPPATLSFYQYICKMHRLLFISIIAISVLTHTSCTKEGCTDSNAINFDADAAADDGSCIIQGCADPEAANYNPRALKNDGSCIYNGLLSIYSQVRFYGTYDADNSAFLSVFVNGSLAGEIADNCVADSINCHTQCSKLTIDGIRQGVHKVSYLVLKKTDTPRPDTLIYGDTLQIEINSTRCNTVILD